jgi:hypothetical protein
MKLIEILENQIREKYATVDKSKQDTYIPYSLINHLNYGQESLSENAGNFLHHTNKDGFEQLVKSIKKPRKVHITLGKEYDIDLVSIGYGGVMINMLYFMSKIIDVEASRKMEHISIYEDDNLSLLNAVRIFKDLSKIKCLDANKVNIYREEESMSKYKTSKYTTRFCEYYINTENIFIGSPDFETRKLFEDREDVTFLFIGNNGSEITIHKNPVTDNNMAVETYGKLNIQDFFRLVLYASYAMVNIINNKDKLWSVPNNTLLYKKVIGDDETEFSYFEQKTTKYSKEALNAI